MQKENYVYFRGINFSELLLSYIDGKTEMITEIIPVDHEMLIEKNKPVISRNLQKYSYEVDLGLGRMFAMIPYKIYDNGKYGLIDMTTKKYNCMNCIRKIQDKPIGIPIKRESKGEKTYYHMIDIFCGISCAYAEVLIRMINNPIYDNSIEYLSEISLNMTGKLPRPAKDKRLLQIYNGEMTWEEYHISENNYTSKPGSMIYMGTAEYIEED